MEKKNEQNQNQNQNQNQINCNNESELYQKAAEKQSEGYEITKIYNQKSKGIFAFLFKKKS